MRPMADRDVRVYEVGPRDGLQNEKTPIPTGEKLRFLALLADAGLREIEATSFVSPQAIPQLADADELMASLERRPGVRYPVLVPNERGLARAEAAGVDAICVFTAASEPFTKANINMTIAESIDAFRPIVETAHGRGWWTRGYLSTAFGCPYQGEVSEAAVVGRCPTAHRARRGRGLDRRHDRRRRAGGRSARRQRPARRGDRASNGWRCTSTTRAARRSPTSARHSSLGIRCFDASTGGTGGCPYAPGAAGNLATEDLVYLLDREGMTHGVDLDAVLVAARHVSETLGRPLATKVGQAGGWRVP